MLKCDQIGVRTSKEENADPNVKILADSIFSIKHGIISGLGLVSKIF